jgi:hypothetical protein
MKAYYANKIKCMRDRGVSRIRCSPREKDRVERAPEMGKCPGPEKCRGQERNAGAEDGELWWEMVRVHAAVGDAVARPGAMSMAGVDGGRVSALTGG